MDRRQLDRRPSEAVIGVQGLRRAMFEKRLPELEYANDPGLCDVLTVHEIEVTDGASNPGRNVASPMTRRPGETGIGDLRTCGNQTELRLGSSPVIGALFAVYDLQACSFPRGQYLKQPPASFEPASASRMMLRTSDSNRWLELVGTDNALSGLEPSAGDGALLVTRSRPVSAHPRERRAPRH